jgi:hypothetical protein
VIEAPAWIEGEQSYAGLRSAGKILVVSFSMSSGCASQIVVEAYVIVPSRSDILDPCPISPTEAPQGDVEGMKAQAKIEVDFVLRGAGERPLCRVDAFQVNLPERLLRMLRFDHA